MGMHIDSSTLARTSASKGMESLKRRPPDFTHLFSALKNGDLAGAKQAFAQLGIDKKTQAPAPLIQISQALAMDNLPMAQQAAQQMQTKRMRTGEEKTQEIAPRTGPVSLPPDTQLMSRAGAGQLLDVSA